VESPKLEDILDIRVASDGFLTACDLDGGSVVAQITYFDKNRNSDSRSYPLVRSDLLAEFVPQPEVEITSPVSLWPRLLDFAMGKFRVKNQDRIIFDPNPPVFKSSDGKQFDCDRINQPICDAALSLSRFTGREMRIRQLSKTDNTQGSDLEKILQKANKPPVYLWADDVASIQVVMEASSLSEVASVKFNLELYLKNLASFERMVERGDLQKCMEAKCYLVYAVADK
jgi:hypothetical protein